MRCPGWRPVTCSILGHANLKFSTCQAIHRGQLVALWKKRSLPMFWGIRIKNTLQNCFAYVKQFCKAFNKRFVGSFQWNSRDWRHTFPNYGTTHRLARSKLKKIFIGESKYLKLNRPYPKPCFISEIPSTSHHPHNRYPGSNCKQMASSVQRFIKIRKVTLRVHKTKNWNNRLKQLAATGKVKLVLPGHGEVGVGKRIKVFQI